VISGIVTDRHAIVSLTFLLANGSTFPIEFVIDTGFTDHLCLPPEAVNLLRLPFLYDLPANLADNSSVVLPVHREPPRDPTLSEAGRDRSAFAAACRRH
jgi:predicted aspartyl protease